MLLRKILVFHLIVILTLCLLILSAIVNATYYINHKDSLSTKSSKLKMHKIERGQEQDRLIVHDPKFGLILVESLIETLVLRIT